MNRKLFGFTLTSVVSLLLLQLPQSFAYRVDAANRIITVSPQATPAATATEVRSASSYLLNRADKTSVWTWRFNPGNYYMAMQAPGIGMKNVNLVSDPANPAKLIKAPGWSASNGEYLLNFQMCNNMSMTGFEFFGLTKFTTNSNPVWPDQGVHFGSCNTVKVDKNKFYNFGNAALRVETAERDPVRGVNSFNTTVTNNVFNNFYQISTTANDLIHGGTANYLLQGNKFANIRGSVKFATRTAGAKNVKIIGNDFNGGNHFGLEINNYEDMEIRSNTFENIASVAINMYTASDTTRVAKGFPWGNNFIISDNTIKNCGRAIRYDHPAFIDGIQNIVKNLTINNNTLSTITERNTYVPAINISGGKVDIAKITSNKMYSISSKKYIGVTPGSTNVSILSNIVDGVAYLLKTVTASN